MEQQIHTVDLIIPRYKYGALKVELEIPLVRRLRPGTAYYGHLALPGGKLEESDYDLPEAAQREAHEELGLVIPTNRLTQIGTYATLGRDPRPGRWISTLFLASPGPWQFPGSKDKQECRVEVMTLAMACRETLAFDHHTLLWKAIQVLQSRNLV